MGIRRLLRKWGSTGSIGRWCATNYNRLKAKKNMSEEEICQYMFKVRYEQAGKPDEKGQFVLDTFFLSGQEISSIWDLAHLIWDVECGPIGKGAGNIVSASETRTECLEIIDEEMRRLGVLHYE